MNAGNMLISWIHQKLEKQILISSKGKLGITALIIAFAIEFRFYLRPTNLNFLLLIYETKGNSSKRFPLHIIIQFTLDRNLGLNDLKDSDED